MKTALSLVTVLTLGGPMQAQDTPLFTLEQYLLDFDYAERRDMKIGSKDLVRMLTEKKVVLVDIRFKEEHTAWHMGFGLQIPLNELPKRLKELDRTKLIVTATECFTFGFQQRIVIGRCDKNFFIRFRHQGPKSNDPDFLDQTC